MAIPFEQVLDGRAERLQTLKQDVVCAGIRAVTGIEMPVNPKRRFQDGALATPRDARDQGLVPADVQPNLAGAAEGSRGTRAAIGQRGLCSR